MQMELEMQGQALEQGAKDQKEVAETSAKETQKRLDLIREAVLTRPAEPRALLPGPVSKSPPLWEIIRDGDNRIQKLVARTATETREVKVERDDEGHIVKVDTV
jgi:hypothetical protein